MSRPLQGQTEDALLQHRESAQIALMSGRRVVQFSGDGESGTYQFSASPRALIDLINRELYHIDPVKYPMATVRPIRYTQASFRNR